MIITDIPLIDLHKKMNDSTEIWYSGNTIFVPMNVYFLTWKDFDKKVANYENIFFTTSEHFCNEQLIFLLKKWVKLGKKIYFKNFTFGYTKYLQKVIDSENIITPDLHLTFLIAHSNCRMMHSYDKEINNPNNKKILLNYMTFNRNLSKDYVMQNLIINNELHLDNRNFIAYHNYNSNNQRNTPEYLKKYRYLYDTKEHREFISKYSINLEMFTDLKLIPESENFHISNEQNKQKNRLCELHNQSMFNIISEACMPYSEDPENIWYYHASISPKTIWPLYFKNVFHYSPNPKIFNEALEELGFKTFFNNDSEFLNSLNEEYYYSSEVQEKLFHNHMHLNNIVENGWKKYNLRNGWSPAGSWIQKYIKNPPFIRKHPTNITR